jgi:hypothetical protein
MQSRIAGRALCVSILSLAASAAAHAQCPTPDSFEPNNDCFGAVTITAGSYPGLTCYGPGFGADNPDFYKIDVPAGDQINVQIHHSYAEDEDLDIYLYDAADSACGDRATFLAQAYHSANNEFASWVNSTGSTVTCVIEVAAWQFSKTPVGCEDYDLLVDVGPDLCAGSTDDALEDNDTCATVSLLTTGIHTGLLVRDTDTDHYQTVVQPNDRVTIDLFYGIDGPGQDLSIELYSDPNCVFLEATDSWEGSNAVGWSNATGSPVTVSFIVTTLDAPACNEYSLQVSTAPDPCLLSPDDSLEPNDSCQSPGAMAVGNFTNLFVSRTSPDYYSITLQPLDRLVVETSYLSSNGELALELATDVNCLDVVASHGLTGSDHVEYGNNTGAPVDMRIAVSVPTFSDIDCNSYDLDVSIVLDPCLQLPDDSFEPNDDCVSAVSLTSGTQTGLFMVENDPDYFKVTVQDGEQLNARIDYSLVGGGLSIRVTDDLFCFGQLDFASSEGSDLVTWTNTTGSAQDYTIIVDIPEFAPTTCKDYDLDISVVPDPCINAFDDGLEDNDSCASAVGIGTGLMPNLFVSGTDQDFYTVSVPSGQRLTLDFTYDPIDFPLIISLYSDSSCTTLVDQQGWNGAESLLWSNSGANSTTVAFSVETDGSGVATCHTYDMNVDLVADPCLTVPDDIYEDNDNCFAATPLVHGTYPSLFSSSTDPDFYSFTLNNGQSVEIHAFHSAANGDLDLTLFDAAFQCNNPFGYIASGATAQDDEVLFYSNNTGSAATFYLQVEPWEAGKCNTYDLTLLLAGNPLAARICAGDGSFNAGQGPIACPCGNLSAPGSEEGCLNSQGHGAILHVSGSVSYANDDAVFTITQGRPNQPSLLVQGTSLTAFAFKDGILCMGTPTERVEVVFLDGTGSASTTGSIVTNGNVPGPGITRYYQQWYRDPNLSVCGTGSNFSSGLIVNWL